MHPAHDARLLPQCYKTAVFSRSLPAVEGLELKPNKSVYEQALEIEGMTYGRKPAHPDALLRQLTSLGNLEEVRLMTNFKGVASHFNATDQQRLKKLLPASQVSFIGHRMCGPNCLPLC